PRWEHRRPEGGRARDRAVDRARRVREVSQAKARRHPPRRRHLRDDRAHELRLPAAGGGVFPRLLRADADQARAAALPEDDVSRIDLLSSAGCTLRDRYGRDRSFSLRHRLPAAVRAQARGRRPDQQTRPHRGGEEQGLLRERQEALEAVVSHREERRVGKGASLMFRFRHDVARLYPPTRARVRWLEWWAKARIATVPSKHRVSA